MLALVLLAFFTSFFSTYIACSSLIPILQKRGFLGIDMNKYSKPKVPEPAGLAVVFGFFVGISLASLASVYLFPSTLKISALVATLATVLAVAFIGFIDDILGWKKGIHKWQHVVMPIIASFPLMVSGIANSSMWIPFIGTIGQHIYVPLLGVLSFSFIYSVFLIPLAVTGASNATNMLAGFNGLEAGLMSIILAFLALTGFITVNYEALIVAIAMLASMLAFLRFNWYPAKVFGGDTLTLTGGATIAIVAILLNREFLAVAMMLPYFIELFLKARVRFKAECFGIPQKNGRLKAPKKIASLTHVVMLFGRNKLNEVQVVCLLLLLQFFICLASFLLLL